MVSRKMRLKFVVERTAVLLPAYFYGLETAPFKVIYLHK